MFAKLHQISHHRDLGSQNRLHVHITDGLFIEHTAKASIGGERLEEERFTVCNQITIFNEVRVVAPASSCHSSGLRAAAGEDFRVFHDGILKPPNYPTCDSMLLVLSMGRQSY